LIDKLKKDKDIANINTQLSKYEELLQKEAQSKVEEEMK